MERRPHHVNKSLDRGLSILALFGREARFLTAKQIADLLGVLPTTIYPSLHTLAFHGYLEIDERKRYSLGLKLLELAGEVSLVLDLRAIARGELEALSRRLGANGRLAILYGDRVLYLERVNGGPDTTVGEVVGVSVPSHCTALGKTLLAHQEPDDRKRLLECLPLERVTEYTITSVDRLTEELDKAKARGYSVEMEEFHLGGACFAAPVFDSQGRIAAAISLSLLASRARGEDAEAIVEEVKETARKISYRMGHKPQHQKTKVR